MSDFRDLHRPGEPLLLPNAWDVASALALAAAGFAAIGTTSLGVAAAHGLPDGRERGKSETLELVRALRGRLGVPLTVDVEGGFGGGPDEVAELAAELYAAGAAGINVEDGRPGGVLAEAADQAALIVAIKERVPGLFVNARTDTCWLRTRTGETESRCRAYRDAGADGLFVPALTEAGDIRMLAGIAPLNLLALPGMTVRELAALGVARVSTGSLLFRTALTAAVSVAREIRAGAPVPGGVLSYAETNSYAEVES